jgi:hypothetical protein
MAYPSQLVAALATSATLLAACGPSWPSGVAATVAPRAQPVRTIDVLPLDLQVWTHPALRGKEDEIRARAEARILGTAGDALVRRGDAITMIDWNGDTMATGQPANAISRDDLLATVDSLSAYGAQAEAKPHTLPIPYLPARLGTTTGSDATLYVGGWAYVGADDGDGVGTKIAEGILIGVAIIAVVGLIALAASSKSHGHGGSHSGSSHGSSGGSGGHVAAGGGGTVATGWGHQGMVSTGRGDYRPHSGHPRATAAGDIADATLDVVDAFGHVIIDVGRPDYYAGTNVPHDGDSKMYLEMTLVDNHTGLALWHAHQAFPAGADHPEDVTRVANMLLATMPR